MGPLYRRLLTELPWLLGESAAFFLATWLALRSILGLSKSLTEQVQRTLLREARGTDWRWMVPMAVTLLAVTDFAGFTQGFFRYDDFAFVQDLREPLAFQDYLALYHNDHALPGFRVALWLVDQAAGGISATSEELSNSFNFLAFAILLGVILTGGWLMGELGTTRISLVLGILLLWTWPAWGEFTAGFYTFLIFPGAVVGGFSASAALVRGIRLASSGWLALCLLLATGTALWATAGLWVFAVLFLFLAAKSDRNQISQSGAILACLAICAGVVLFYYMVWSQHSMTGRELVQNPGGAAVSKHFLGGNLVMRPVQVASGMAGVFLGWIIPPAAELVFVRPERAEALRAIIYALEAGALVLMIGIGYSVWRRLNRQDRLLFAALVGAAVACVGMVVLARGFSLEVPGALWPAKYKCAPLCWAAVAATFALDRGLRARAMAGRCVLVPAGMGIAIAGWMFASQWRFEEMLSIRTPWHAGGRNENQALARLRRANFIVLRNGLRQVSQETGRKELPVPRPRGAELTFRYLEFGSHPLLGANYSLEDLMAIAPDTGISLKLVEVSSIPEDVRVSLERNVELRTFFFGANEDCDKPCRSVGATPVNQ